MTAPWLAEEREELATTRILDAAAGLFARDGVGSVGMAEVAAAAGCSRATLYRYFPNRDALRMAFVQREARRLGVEIAAATARRSDPATRLEAAVLKAVDAVRADPLLAAWFTPESAGIAVDLAAASEVIESLAAAFVGAEGLGAEGVGAEGVEGAGADVARDDAARWVVRVVVSLLAMPGGDRAEERRFVRHVLVPAVLR